MPPLKKSPQLPFSIICVSLLNWLFSILVAPAAALGPSSAMPRLETGEVVLHVDVDGGSDTRGKGTMRAPLSTIRGALGRLPDGGGIILVAEGSYAEGELDIPRGVRLYGGFKRGDWTTREVMAYPTVLDGEEKGRVLRLNDAVWLDGFHITGGKISAYGAGILCDGTSPTIVNNVIHHNVLLAPEGWNPKYRHELSWDGAGIACLNGASPVIANNIFAFNETVIGRGAAITAHMGASPVIRANVIMHNVVGTDDPMRSSEGAVSAYGEGEPLIEGNLIAMNHALTNNDAGGIFIALWVNPVIRHNWILGNFCDDDGAGLFIGGQEHRYDKPLDPVPPRADFNFLVENNIFMGNRNPTENSGAMRITMESRGRLFNNLIARNGGGVYLQRSELEVYHNTIDDELLMVETKHTLGSSDVRNNLILETADLQAPTAYTHNASRNFTYGEGNFVITESQPNFKADGFTAAVATQTWHAHLMQTQVDIFSEEAIEEDLSGRVIRIGEFWSVVASNTPLRLFIWGQVPAAEPLTTKTYMEVLPTYQPEKGAPFIDRGTSTSLRKDMLGRPRPVVGTGDNRPDLGAYEFQP